MHMNVKLIRISQFLRQFDLQVTHKPGKEHIVPDALSRLASLNQDSTIAPEHSELDVLFTTSLVQMSTDFHDRCVQGYQQDPYWKRISRQLDNNMDLSKNATSLPFMWGRDLLACDSGPYFLPRPGESPEDLTPLPASLLSSGKGSQQAAPLPNTSHQTPKTPPLENQVTTVDDLIFHVDRLSGNQRFCIPSDLVQEILAIAHGTNGHPGFQRCHEIVTASWYIHGITKQLRDYIRHCLECIVLQTRRHQPYGNLQPISTPDSRNCIMIFRAYPRKAVNVARNSTPDSSNSE